MPFSFPRIVTVFPFLHSLSPGTGRRTRAKSEARKRKETPRKLGVSEINAAFSSDYRSGETGIRTLGTLAGTPVFKTGAIGRSAISPGRMLLRSSRTVNVPVFEQTQSPTTGSVQIDSIGTDHEKSGSHGTSALIQQRLLRIQKLRGTSLQLGNGLREDKVGLATQSHANAFHDSLQMRRREFCINWQ